MRNLMFLNDVVILQFTKIVLPSENIRLNQGCKANPDQFSRSNMNSFAIFFYSLPSHFSNVERYIFIYIYIFFTFQPLCLMFHLYLAFNFLFFAKNFLHMLKRILQDAVSMTDTEPLKWDFRSFVLFHFLRMKREVLEPSLAAYGPRLKGTSALLWSHSGLSLYCQNTLHVLSAPGLEPQTLRFSAQPPTGWVFRS